MNTQHVAPDDIFDLRFVHDARLSPDAQKVAYIVSHTQKGESAERSELWMKDLQTGDTLRLSSVEVFAANPRWSPNGEFIAFVRIDTIGNCLCVLSTLTGITREFAAPDQAIEGAPTWSPEGTRLAVCTRKVSARTDNRRIRSRVYRLEGRGYYDSGSYLQLLNCKDGAFTEFACGDGIWSAPKWAPNNNEILLLVAPAKKLGTCQFPHLCSINASTGQIRPVLDEPWAIEGAEWSPDGARIIFAGSYASTEKLPAAALWVISADGSDARCRTNSSVPHVGFRFHHDMPVWGISPALAIPNDEFAFVTVQAGGRSSIFRIALFEDVNCTEIIGGDRSCMILDASAIGRQLLLWATSFDMPCELSVVRWDDPNSEHPISDHNSQVLSRWPTMRFQHVPIVSADGLPLDGWYMARADAKGPRPTILFIHGGPYIGIGCVFRFDFWMLASHGYAILFTNYRGSLGYGAAFSLAIDSDWGVLGFQDHMAAVDTAVERGLSDAKRLGIWGASHGGFATAWAICHSPRFRAAVVEASITDFTSAYYLSDLPDFISLLFGGKPNQLPDTYRSASPLTYAANCKTPTLVLHGEKDVRCPIAGAASFFRALLDGGCVAEFVALKDCDHMGDSTGPLSARLGQNEALLDWFSRQL